MKESLKPIALAAGIYGAMYAGLEAMHNVECPREDLHSTFVDNHSSKQMLKDRELSRKNHLIRMQEHEENYKETQQIFDDINRTMDEITFKLGVIQGILIARGEIDPENLINK